MQVVERFLNYVAVDTESVPEQEQIPSSEKQFDLARKLEQELREMGASDVRLDGHCYVYAKIPSNVEDTSSRFYRTYGYFTSHLRCKCKTEDSKRV